MSKRNRNKTKMPRTEEFYKNRRRDKRIQDLKRKKCKQTNHNGIY